ncbi:gpW family head-tail joining protein [Terasakiella sp.]|uniref:gpW family head-tail joining protein n=1 Tax=Terasakiella sp. TaxID=2034861 RepID=UPI003AA9C8EC
MTDKAELEERLKAAKTALHKLLLGEKAQVMGYDGKTVTYTPADETSLRRYIRELSIELGYPVRPRVSSFRY